MSAVAPLLCAVMVSGCAYNQVPRIDPSGEHVFLPPANAPPPRYTEEPGGQLPWDDVAVTLSPRLTVAPIGSEVVLVAGVRGPDNYLMTNRRLEWSLDPGGAGHFIDVGKNGVCDLLLGDFNMPGKVDNTYAIGSTSRHYLRLTRGTPTPSDDVFVLAGQGWITVTSPVEGSSHVTVFAPEVYPWDARTQSATIHWVDAQWVFPPPAINPAGTRHTFTTSVMRHSDQSPCVNWRVRYEILDGPAAGFAPDGARAVEVPTDPAGQARADIFQRQPSPGTNKIGIQIIRPDTLPGADGRRLVVGTGTTMKTWTAAAIALRKTGPAVGTVGATLTYRTEVANPGDQPAGEVMVTEQVPEGLSFISSTPPAAVAGRTLQWRLGSLGGGLRSTIDVNYRAERPGSVTDCAEVVAAAGLRASDCATTTVSTAAVSAAIATLDLKITGPAQVNVGSMVTFEMLISNRGQAPATNVVIRDTFEAGLEHALANPIQRRLGNLAPGESQQIRVTFRATKAGRLCHTVEVAADNGLRAAETACVVAIEAGPPPAITPATPAPTQQLAVSVKTSATGELMVGQTAAFTIGIINRSDRALSKLTVVAKYDASLPPSQATDGYNKLQNSSLAWTIDLLPAGESSELQMICGCKAAAARACVHVTASAPGGARSEGEACVAIREAPGGPPPGGAAPRETPPGRTAGGLTMTVTALSKPVAVGKSLTYEIRVVNEAETPDRLVSVLVSIPEGMSPDPLGTTGPSGTSGLSLSRPTISQQTIRFDPVPEIGPHETLVYRVRARTRQPGQFRLRVELTSLSQPRPVVVEETTDVIP